jgi:hypothetical protein
LGAQSYSDDAVVGSLFEYGRELRKQYNCTTLLVHHPGKDDTRGSAGSNRFNSDPDCILRTVAMRDGTFRVVKDKDRNGPKRPLFDFELAFVEVERTANGTPRTGAILGTVSPCTQESMPQHAAPAGSNGSGEQPKKRQMPDRWKIALEGLTEALIEAGKAAPAEMQLASSVRVVDQKHWHQELIHRGVIRADDKNPHQTFRRIREGLLAAHHIGARDELVWPVSEGGEH